MSIYYWDLFILNFRKMGWMIWKTMKEVRIVKTVLKVDINQHNKIIKELTIIYYQSCNWI
jgi:hypothetical protein